MHRCLAIPEVVIEIMNALSEPAPISASVEEYPEFATLASAARACKLFYEPAVSKLWAELDNVDPLCHLLSLPPAGDQQCSNVCNFFSLRCSLSL